MPKKMDGAPARNWHPKAAATQGTMPRSRGDLKLVRPSRMELKTMAAISANFIISFWFAVSSGRCSSR